MDKDEVEDVGISVEGLLDSNIKDITEKRLKDAGNMPENGITLDSQWTTTSEVMTVDATVMALLVKNTGGGGVVRVLSKPAKYTKSDGLHGVILLVLKPGKSSCSWAPY